MAKTPCNCFCPFCAKSGQVQLNEPGGLYGYSSGNCSLPMKMPPSYGVPLGPSNTKYHLRILEGRGRAVICGGGSRAMLRSSLRKRCYRTEKRRDKRLKIGARHTREVVSRVSGFLQANGSARRMTNVLRSTGVHAPCLSLRP